VRRGNPNFQIFLPDEEPARSQTAKALAQFLVASVQREDGVDDSRGRTGILITLVNGTSVAEHPIARFLLDAGFQAAPLGFNVRRNLPTLPGRTPSASVTKEDGYA
jgi:ATP-dependent Lhr-like helicase